jgi:hypothetical protein
MNDWQHVEIHYANQNMDGTYGQMCINALPWEFVFCVLPSMLLGSRGKSSVILSPAAYFQSFGHLPNCPIFVDEILPNLHASLDIENEFWSDMDVEETRAMMLRLGYVESKELEDFMVGIYRELGERANPWKAK